MNIEPGAVVTVVPGFFFNKESGGAFHSALITVPKKP
jgi:hypothetical protein